MAVVVLDASGHTRSAQRQVGASMFRIDIATGKAWASIAMGRDWVDASPAEAIPNPSADIPRDRFLDMKEVARLKRLTSDIG